MNRNCLCFVQALAVVIVKRVWRERRVVRLGRCAIGSMLGFFVSSRKALGS